MASVACSLAMILLLATMTIGVRLAMFPICDEMKSNNESQLVESY
jgi:hypothetical protein